MIKKIQMYFKTCKTNAQTIGTINKLLENQFEPINKPIINCWNSNDLSFFLNPKRGNEIIIKLLKSVLVYDEKISDIELSSISSLFFSKSKAWGYNYDSLYLFGENTFKEKKWSLDFCLGWESFNKQIIQVRHYRWNNKYAWANQGGSHHFGVAVYHLINADKCCLQSAKIIEISISADIVLQMQKSYDMFVCDSGHKNFFINLFSRENVHIVEYNSNVVLLVFQKENESMKQFISLLDNLDERYILNLNTYIEERLEKQNRIQSKKQ